MSLVLLGILNSQVTAGEGSDYEHIATAFGNNTSSLTFSNINTSTYRQLEIRGVIQSDKDEVMTVRFNGDSSASYAYGFMGASGTGLQAYNFQGLGAQIEFGEAFADDINSNAVGVFRMNILNASGDFWKSVLTTVGQFNADRKQVRLAHGKWENTSAITSITFGVTGGGIIRPKARFSLYGIRG